MVVSLFTITLFRLNNWGDAHMRVIGGKAKGHRLMSPDGMHVRPTTDRVKEAVFNSIQQYLSDAVILDLFAGAGTLGIEGLSRYAERTYFVDSSLKQIELIKKNLIKTKLMDRAVLLCSDTYAAVDKLSENGMKFDLIFLDPPYNKGFVQGTLEKLDHSQLLSRSGLIIVEYSLREEPPLEIGSLERTMNKRYGSTGVAYFRRREE